MIAHSESTPIPAPILGREQLIARIVDLNPTATTAFLNSFSVEELQRYFDHLRNPDRGMLWVRPNGSRAVVARESTL